MKKKFAIILLFFLVSTTVAFLFPRTAFAQDCPPAGDEWLYNPLRRLGVCRPGDLVVRAFGGFAAIMAFVAIAFTVFSGVKMILATSEEAIESAKKSLTWSVGGFVVALLSFTLIAGTARFLGFSSFTLKDRPKILNPIDIGGGDEAGSRDFIAVMFFTMRNFLGIVGFATIVMIIYYGYKYMTAAGNEEMIEGAKRGLKWAIIGFIVVLLAFTIIAGVQRILLYEPPQ